MSNDSHYTESDVDSGDENNDQKGFLGSLFGLLAAPQDASQAESDNISPKAYNESDDDTEDNAPFSIIFNNFDLLGKGLFGEGDGDGPKKLTSEQHRLQTVFLAWLKVIDKSIARAINLESFGSPELHRLGKLFFAWQNIAWIKKHPNIPNPIAAGERKMEEGSETDQFNENSLDIDEGDQIYLQTLLYAWQRVIKNKALLLAYTSLLDEGTSIYLQRLFRSWFSYSEEERNARQGQQLYLQTLFYAWQRVTKDKNDASHNIEDIVLDHVESNKIEKDEKKEDQKNLQNISTIESENKELEHIELNKIENNETKEDRKNENLQNTFTESDLVKVPVADSLKSERSISKTSIPNINENNICDDTINRTLYNKSQPLERMEKGKKKKNLKKLQNSNNEYDTRNEISIERNEIVNGSKEKNPEEKPKKRIIRKDGKRKSKGGTVIDPSEEIPVQESIIRTPEVQDNDPIAETVIVPVQEMIIDPIDEPIMQPIKNSDEVPLSDKRETSTPGENRHIPRSNNRKNNKNKEDSLSSRDNTEQSFKQNDNFPSDHLINFNEISKRESSELECDKQMMIASDEESEDYDTEYSTDESLISLFNFQNIPEIDKNESGNDKRPKKSTINTDLGNDYHYIETCYSDDSDYSIYEFMTTIVAERTSYFHRKYGVPPGLE